MSVNRAKLQSYHNLTTDSKYEHVSSILKGTNKISLDDYILELKQRNDEDQMSHDNNRSQMSDIDHYLDQTERPNDSSQSNRSFYENQHLQIQLAKKEKDLILAAELGKALLDRNEELTRTNEQINEEYTHNLEVS